MKRASSKPSSAERPALAREEWDFRAQPEKAEKTFKKVGGDWTAGRTFPFLADDEVWFCWNYELTRMEPEWTHGRLAREVNGKPAGTPYRVGNEVAYILDWRAGATKPNDFDSLLDHYWGTDPNGKHGVGLSAGWSYKIWPEWPAEPFLSVGTEERQRRFKRYWEHEPGRTLELIRLRDIYRYVAAFKAGKVGRSENPWRGNYVAELGEDVWTLTDPHPRNACPRVEIAAFEIDFNLRDDTLATRFQRWVEARRKEKNYLREDHRGNSQTKQLRKALRALGAVRLLDSGLSIKEAMDYTDKVSGAPLYRHQGDWSEARQTATEALHRAN